MDAEDSPSAPPANVVLSLVATARGALSTAELAERSLRMTGRCAVPPAAPERSPVGTRRTTSILSLAAGASMAVTPLDREMVVFSEGASAVIASLLGRVVDVVTLSAVSTGRRSRVTRGRLSA
jgi:hypothetical protein